LNQLNSDVDFLHVYKDMTISRWRLKVRVTGEGQGLRSMQNV